MERIVGTRDEVTRRLYAAQQRGADLTLSNPRVLPDGRWSVEVERRAPTRRGPLLERRAPASSRVGVRGRWIAAGAVVVLAAVAGLAWAIWWVATWAAAHAAQILGALVVLVLLATALARATGGRSGRHCPGPWHR